jgi:hypothetical protein
MILAVFLGLLLSLAGAEQAPPPEIRTLPTRKPAWEWTIEERIAKRIDPASIHERAEAEREQNFKDGFTPEFHASIGMPNPTEHFIVQGGRDPELLLPFELFGSILQGVDTDPEEPRGWRARYRASIREFGWEEQTFWNTLQEASAEYRKIQHERLALEYSAPSLPLVERRAATIKAEALGISNCRLRAKALQTVREKLGRDKFDHFLYEKVAPNVSISSGLPFVNNEEWRLKFVEGGCQ